MSADELRKKLHQKTEKTSEVKEDASIASSSNQVEEEQEFDEELSTLYGDRDVVAEDIEFIESILVLCKDLTKIFARNSITSSDKVHWAVRSAQAASDLERYLGHLQDMMEEMDLRIEEKTAELQQ